MEQVMEPVMDGTRAVTWHEANQRYLVAALALVRQALERHAARVQGRPLPAAGEAPAAMEAARRALPAPAALDTLCMAFGLSPFERNVLLLCAGVELDAGFAALCTEVQGAAQHTGPTFGLALAALPEAHWSALSPNAPLRRWRLVELERGEALTQCVLRIDERVLHYLTGVACIDERLAGLVHPLAPPSALPPSQQALATRIAALWAPARAGTEPPLLQLCGEAPAGTHAVAAAACVKLGLRLYVLQAADLPLNPAEREMLARLWEREAALTGSALLLDCEELDAGEAAQPVLSAARRFVESVHGFVAVAGREPLAGISRTLLRLDVERPCPAEQSMLWRSALGPLAGALNGRLEALTQQFSLGAPAIFAACAAVAGVQPASTDAGELFRTLWDTCRAQARPRLDDLAQRITPVATWEDLVLPDRELQVLREIAVHVRQRARVYDEWGFAARSSRGLGISALFAGPSGTGKTMAAEVLANELRLDLYRIDLSQVVSKYIGETEKNLRRVFDAAESGGSILLFDEADALFGKRSEVKDSHDRYANIEVSYLLQRMEAYRGLAILTTNLKSALDPAFLRRIRFVVSFPFPDATQRAEIWRRVFPPGVPREGLEIERLARLNVAGGNIRNIALYAAFLAAEEGTPVCMAHLLRAARVEYAKLEKALTDVEIGGWV